MHCRKNVENKIHEASREAEKGTKGGGSSKISAVMHAKIDKAVFARAINETMEMNHEKVVVLRFQIEQIEKLFRKSSLHLSEFRNKLDSILTIRDKSQNSTSSIGFALISANLIKRLEDEFRVFNGIKSQAAVGEDKAPNKMENAFKNLLAQKE